MGYGSRFFATLLQQSTTLHRPLARVQLNHLLGIRIIKRYLMAKASTSLFVAASPCRGSLQSARRIVYATYDGKKETGDKYIDQ